MSLQRPLLYAIAVLFFSIGCNYPNNHHIQPYIIDTVQFVPKDSLPPGKAIKQSDENADMVYKMILSLPEVGKRARHIQEQTKGKRHLEVMIAEFPNGIERDYYWVRAGEVTDDDYITHFNFYVFPKNNWEIKYFDPVRSSVITLEEWRLTGIKY